MEFPAHPDLQLIRPTSDRYESGKDFYGRSYPHLLSSIQALADDPDGNAIMLIAHAVYGWMPTTLKSCNVDAFSGMGGTPIQRIRQAKKASTFEKYFCDLSPINRSWIGLSKFLHFVNPFVFPIWDKKVALHFGLSYSQSFNRKSAYFSYCEWVEQNLTNAIVGNMRERNEALYGYVISDVRALELGLFLASPMPVSKKPAKDSKQS